MDRSFVLEALKQGYAPLTSSPFAPPPLDAPAHEQAIDYRAAQERRIASHATRIGRELFNAPEVVKSTRGAARGVLCLTRTDPGTGQPRSYPTVSEAAKEARCRVHHIRRACLGRNAGARCRGHVYAYLDDPALSPAGPVQLQPAAA